MRFLLLILIVILISPVRGAAAEETNAPASTATASPGATATASTNAVSKPIAAVSDSSATNATNVTTSAPVPVSSAGSVPSGFEAYKIIALRNIFDPNRQKPGVRRTDEEAPKAVKIDYLTLLGAMSYEKGDFAFFDGTSSEFRKSVKTGDSIAGYKVKTITQSKVTLENDGKSVELPVGSQMKRQDEGEWKVNTEIESYNSAAASESGRSSESGSGRFGDRDRRDRGDRRDRYGSRSSSSTESSTSTTTSPASSSSPGDVSDALKRLLERRAKE